MMCNGYIIVAEIENNQYVLCSNYIPIEEIFYFSMVPWNSELDNSKIFIYWKDDLDSAIITVQNLLFSKVEPGFREKYYSYLFMVRIEYDLDTKKVYLC